MRPKAATMCILIMVALAAAHPQDRGLTLCAGEVALIHSGVTASIYNATLVTGGDLADVEDALMDGLPVVFIGDGAEALLEAAETPLSIEDTGDVKAAGVWRHPDQPGAPVSILLVRDAYYTPECLEAAYRWLEEPVEAPAGEMSELYRLVAVLTEVDRQLPLGVLETRTEVLLVLGDPGLIDLTVTQRLTPGSSAGVSGWNWSTLEYAVNGSAPGAGVELASYDEAPRREPPVGIFTLLWRIVTLRWSDLIPWLWGDQGVTWTDMSDPGGRLYYVSIEVPIGSEEAGEPLEARHHLVLRAAGGADPAFCRWTRVNYVKGGALSVERYTAQASAGLIRVRA